MRTFNIHDIAIFESDLKPMSTSSIHTTHTPSEKKSAQAQAISGQHQPYEKLPASQSRLMLQSIF